METENGMMFKEDETAKSPDIKDVITQMIMLFAEEYQKDNPKSKPVFDVCNLSNPSTPIQ
jgi:hypothetical protein